MLSPFISLTCLLSLCAGYFRPSQLSSDPSLAQICPGIDLTDCYPEVFQPTDIFQVIRDGQRVPPGLHIRMNFETGVKEGKINVVDESDDSHLMGTIVVMPEVEKPEMELDDLAAQLSQHVFKPEEDGPIRPPQSLSEGQEFHASKKLISNLPVDSEPELALPAFEALEEVSHDIYWGLQLAKDSDLVHKLLLLLSSNVTDTSLRSAATLLLGTALRNNPSALSNALSHFYHDTSPSGPLETIITVLAHEQLPSLLTRIVYLLSALAQDPLQLWAFIEKSGLDALINVYDAENTSQDDKDRLRGKLADFLLDRFLQPDSPDVTQGSHGMRAPKPTSKATSSASGAATEDSEWLLTSSSAEIRADMQTNGLPLRQRSLAEELRPWCRPFSRSLKAWNTSPTGDASEGFDQVSTAYSALKSKLEGLGSRCD